MNVFFSGPAGTGKSKAAEYLIKHFNYTPAKMAYPVYMIAEKYFGMTNKDRQLLQLIGTDVGRQIIDSDIWINYFIDTIKIVEETANRQNTTVKLVADDVRFVNEFEALHDMGWVGIYLNSPHDLRLKRLHERDGNAQETTLNHVSETEMDKFKNHLIQVDASGSLESLYQQITEILSRKGITK